MKARTPRRRTGAARCKAQEIDAANLASIARPDKIQPFERHFLAGDVVFEPEVPAIELLIGRAQGPGRLGDLMRAVRRP